MKSAFLLLLIITTTPLAFSQTPSSSESPGACNLTFAQVPAIRGLKLGMSLNEALALFPGFSDDNNVKQISNIAKDPLPRSFNPGGDGYGLLSLQMPLRSDPTNPQFTGINYLYLRFFDEKLVSFKLGYSTTIWNNVEEFMTKLVEAYKLPTARAWSLGSQTSRELLCKDFSLKIFASVGSVGDSQLHIDLLRSGWDHIQRQQQERRAAAISKAQRDFKP